MIAMVEPAVSRENFDTRKAQAHWAKTPIRDRLRMIRALRHLIAENAETLAASAAAVSDRPLTEKLTSEVLPLADACRWLERNAAKVLAPRRHGLRGRPLWLGGVSFKVQRQPLGTVLVIGPGNYPLFLPGVHALHALAAGNAVLLKPAPATRPVALLFANLIRDAGLDPTLLTTLPEATEAASDAIRDGVDKVIFTGSSENGHDVLAALARTNTPSVMELSGEDPVIVLADADIDLVVRALRFGTQLNDGNTCIAPRRLIVVKEAYDDLIARLITADFPAPMIEQVADNDAAAESANSGDFGLGASIFARKITKARALAARLKTGFVVINDLIVPTADPRMPFGGVKASGFGSTRGEEGLLEMTFPHVIAIRRGKSHRHFDETAAGDAHLFSAYIRAAHGRDRFAAIRDFAGALFQKSKRPNS
jgi:acyl-CoA reductase-like NAD-dependent aldehyde dehydrogenase